MMTVPGKQFDFLILLVMFAIMAFFVYRARKGKVATLRRLPAIDAIDEVIGRSVELGRPLAFSAGEISAITSAQGLQGVAGLSCLGYVAEKSVRIDCKLYTYTDLQDMYLLEQEVLRSAYILENKEAEYKEERVMGFFGGGGKSIKAGMLGFLAREKPAGNIMIGPFMSSPPYFCEISKEVGAMTIGGTASIDRLCFFPALADYALFGDEVFAAAAYLSKNPMQLATVSGGDYSKIIVLSISVIGFLLGIAGLSTIINLLKW